MSKTINPAISCPMSLGLNVLGGKWNLYILWQLYTYKTLRFNELQRKLGSITTKTLSTQLKELEEMQIISKTIYPEVPPKVEYALTPIGLALEPVFNSLCAWGTQYLAGLNASKASE